MRLLRLAPLVLLCAVAIAVAACGDDPAADRAAGSGGGGLTVAATTTQAADLARQVAGQDADVAGLIPPNADPHDYELRPDDIKALADADVIVRSGGDLDAWLEQAIENAGADAETVTLIDHVETIEGEHGHEEEEEHAEEDEHAAEDEPAEEEGGEPEVDPHWWQDPRNAIKAVAAIEGALEQADPDGAATYRRNADRYTAELQRLDAGVAECIDQIPPAQRKLVTTHDALGYYAKRYGLEVVGAVIPSLSTQAQASAGEVTDLVETIKRERVKAIFAESSVNPKLEQVVADESGAVIGEALWADSLGPEGSAAESYAGAITANTRAIVDGLTGGAATCSLP